MSLFSAVAVLARRAVDLVVDVAQQAVTKLLRLATGVPGLFDRAVQATVRFGSLAWDRHCDLMETRPTYRAELLAAAGAVMAFANAPAALVTAVLGLLGLYVSSYGSSPASKGNSRTFSPRPSSADGAGGGVTLWDRFADRDDWDDPLR